MEKYPKPQSNALQFLWWLITASLEIVTLQPRHCIFFLFISHTHTHPGIASVLDRLILNTLSADS